MEQYIKKSALVAEIARQKAQWRICKSSEAKYRREMLDDISSFIDTLEVKEVDLDSNTLEDNVVIKTDWEGDDWWVLIKKSNKAQKGE